MERTERRPRTRLARILFEHDIDQAQVADGAGVSRVTVHGWYHGHRSPNGTNLVALVKFLKKYEPDITAEDLLSSSDSTQTSAPDTAVPVPSDEESRAALSEAYNGSPDPALQGAR